MGLKYIVRAIVTRVVAAIPRLLNGNTATSIASFAQRGKLVLILLTAFLTGCAAIKPSPSDRVKNEAFRFDCCDVGLNPGTKEMCQMALADEDHVLWDWDGNKYEFIWSDCEKGSEPWRDFQ